MTILPQLVKQIPDVYQGRPTAHWFQHFGMTYIIHQVCAYFLLVIVCLREWGVHLGDISRNETKSD